MRLFAFRFFPRDLALARALFAVCLFFLVAAPGTAHSQTAAPPAEEEVTPQTIEKAVAQAKEAPDLDSDTRAKILELYNQALESLKQKRNYEAATRLPQDVADDVQRQVRRARATLENTAGIAPLPLPEIENLPQIETDPVALKSKLADLEQFLTELTNKLTESKNELARLEAEPKRRSARRKEIRALLSSAPERLDAIRKQLAASSPADEPPLLTAARRTELAARLQALTAERPALETELNVYDAEDAEGLVRLRRDLLSQEVAVLEKQDQGLRERINRLRQKEAEQLVVAARTELARSIEPLKPYIEKSREWAEQAKLIAGQIQNADKKLNEVRSALSRHRAEFEETKQKVQSVGLTGPLGLRLRSIRADLPDAREPRQRVRDRREILERIQWEKYEYDELRSDLAVIEPTVRDIVEIVRQQKGNLSHEEERNLAEAARQVLDMQRQHLDLLIRNNDIYFETLSNLDEAERDLAAVVANFAAYIDENVLWIRSNKPLSLTDLRREKAAARLVDPGRWWECATILFNDVRHSPVPFASALLLFGSLFYFGRQFRRELRDIGRQVERKAFCQILPTLRAAFLTAMISIQWPGLLWYLSWRLDTYDSPASEAPRALAFALFAVAATFFPVELFRQSCRIGGLAHSHFGWSRTSVHRLRTNLRWLILIGLPVMFVTAMLHGYETEPGRYTAERMGFMLSMGVLAFFLQRILRPAGGVLHELIGYERGGWMDRLKYLWPTLAVSLPIGLAVLAGVGYYYSAQQLTRRFHSTFWLLLGLLFLREFLLRWLLVHRRKLSIQQARERRAAAAAEEPPAATETPLLAKAAAEEAAADLATISSQTQRLVRTGLTVALLAGLWVVWVDVLPALNVLDRWTLWWHETTEIAEIPQSGPASGNPLAAVASESNVDLGRMPRTVLKPVTAANLAIAVLIAVLTFIAARNVPGLLEMSLLPRLPLDASVRYAVTRVASYVIVLVGTVLSFNNIGLGWSKIQWLVTALTFGLAFGLQEIFANFVSGLIILFERPVRVGDIVTVDDISGVVSRVRIRATTITNWDRKEFVVPNKEFITGRILNWTLSDSTNRVVINVGIQYGSDTERARELLVQAARQHPLVLDDPPPIATFEGFGESSLNFVLRAFLPSLDNRLAVVHDLHTSIYKAFADAGIRIAFPQRELHVCSLPDAWKKSALPADPLVPSGNGHHHA